MLPRRRLAAALVLLPLLAPPSFAVAGALVSPMAFTPPACGVGPFGDVPGGDPYCPWIQQAKADGITAGCGGGNYCPDAPVTREQLAMMLERAMRGTGDWDPWRGSYRRTLIVNPVLAGDPPVVDAASSGLRLLDLLQSIPDDGDPYLVKIEPGDYDIGSASVVLRSKLAIEGSGQRQTRILAATPALGAAVVASNVIAALAELTLEVEGGAGTFSAVHNTNSAIDLEGVTIAAAGGGNVYGLLIDGSGFCEARESSFTAVSSGNLAAAVYLSGGSTRLRMYRSRALGNGFRDGFPAGSASRGVLVDNGDVELYDSRINAQSATSTNYAVSLINNAQATVRGGGVRSGSGTTAVGLYVQDSLLDVDGGEFVIFSGTNRRAAQCVASAGNGSIDVARARLFGASALYGDAGCPIHASFSQLEGAVTLNGGAITCRAVTDSANNFLASTCP